MNTNAVIKCAWCHKRVFLKFHRVYTQTKEHWQGLCTCGEKNFIYRPGWDHPLFLKYLRKYLSESTGYSKDHLSRIASGKAPLTRIFIDRCCYALKESEAELFV